MFDYVVVGAGFAGSVIAERIANVLGKKVLIIERRNHIGGNCFDYRNKYGIIIHKYGPHIFHTDYKEVVDYLSNFTDWRVYQHRVLACVDGHKVPIPFNFRSMDILFPSSYANKLKEKLLSKFSYGSRVPILELKKTEDPDLNFLADYIYRKIFLNYTTKQWGRRPEEIDSLVTSRVPICVGADDRYFTDKYQLIPVEGYTKIFEKLLDNRNIKLLLNTDFRELLNVDLDSKKIYFLGQEFKGMLVFTGMIDELFDYKFGYLPYRSLRFKFEDFDKEFYQETATVNYPNDYDFTRITEFKHIHPVDVNKTTILTEYPENYEVGKIPYYPVFTPEARSNYEKYHELTQNFKNLILVGRLAEYKYYDMDDIVKRALEIFEEVIR